MKKTLFLFLLLPFLIYGQSQTVDTVSFKDLEYKDYHGTALPERGSLRYKSNEDSPYTGMIVDKYDNGQKRSEAYMVDGRIEGLFTEWNENGQKEGETNFVDGLDISMVTYAWYDNGQMSGEVHLVIDRGRERFEGLWTQWYESGQMQMNTNFKEGEMEGFYADWYENGQKRSEGNSKLGGLRIEWHENGQKAREVNYLNQKKVGKETIWYDNGQIKTEAIYISGNPQPISVKEWDRDGNEIEK
jgi:antitoxin component YwqK of YwqJK toxin-antitoxin module